MRTILLAMLAAAQVQFDVVSIKPGDPSSPESSVYPAPHGLRMKNATLKGMVRMAYGLNEYQLAGGPKWLDSALFNIDAKSPAGATVRQIPEMLQALLAERFKLVFHRETRILPEYALVAAKGGAKLQTASEDEKRLTTTSSGDRMIKGRAARIADLVRMLIGVVGAPVVDRTGIEGQYDFSLEFAPLLGAPDDRLPDVFGALQQLGLKLEPIKGPVEVLAIDKAEMPAAN
jgi:uncharacterized protein (TIGR03435 family)